MPRGAAATRRFLAAARQQQGLIALGPFALTPLSCSRVPEPVADCARPRQKPGHWPPAVCSPHVKCWYRCSVAWGQVSLPRAAGSRGPGRRRSRCFAMKALRHCPSHLAARMQPDPPAVHAPVTAATWSRSDEFPSVPVRCWQGGERRAMAAARGSSLSVRLAVTSCADVASASIPRHRRAARWTRPPSAVGGACHREPSFVGTKPLVVEKARAAATCVVPGHLPSLGETPSRRSAFSGRY